MRMICRRVLVQPVGLVGVLIVGGALLTAMVSLVWTPQDPLAIGPTNLWAAPSAQHPLGTDGLGRDTLSRLMVGAQVTLGTAFASVALATTLGVMLGAVIQFVPSGVSSALERVVDLMVAFPTLVIAMILATASGGAAWAVVVAIGLGSVSTITRTILPELRRSLQTEHVVLARCSGAGPWWLMTRHVLPEIFATLMVRATQLLGIAALAEAGLSFLGLGAQPPYPSWGRMLSEQQDQIYSRPEVLAVPALVIVITTLGFNLLGDALRDALDGRIEVG